MTSHEIWKSAQTVCEFKFGASPVDGDAAAVATVTQTASIQQKSRLLVNCVVRYETNILKLGIKRLRDNVTCDEYSLIFHKALSALSVVGAYQSSATVRKKTDVLKLLLNAVCNQAAGKWADKTNQRCTCSTVNALLSAGSRPGGE